MKRTSTSCRKLLRAEDEVILSDAGYTSDESRQLGIRWCVQDKRKPGRNLSGSQKKRNRKHFSIRAQVEHVFRVIKRQFGFIGTRYRRLIKNAVQINMLMGLANLYLLRRRNCWLLEEKSPQNALDGRR